MSETAMGPSGLNAFIFPFLLLCSSILLIHPAEGGILLGSSSVAASTAKFRLCGKHLADLLSLVCRGRGFYNPGLNGAAYRENRLGVSDECCRMGCTEATLESYCAEPPSSGEAQSSPEVIGNRQNRVIPSSSRSGEEARLRAEDEGLKRQQQQKDRNESSSSESSSSSEVAKVRRGRGKGNRRRRRRKDGGGGRRRRLDELDERGRRRREKGRRCRCGKRRRRKEPDGQEHQYPNQQLTQTFTTLS